MVTFTADFTGSITPEEKLAAKRLIRIVNANLATQTPPGDPLPDANDVQLKASYLSIGVQQLAAWHAGNVNEVKAVFNLKERLNESELQSVASAINTRLDAGDSVATILTDLQS